jgi:hypothetical protein
MTTGLNIMGMIASTLGPELFTACQRNDIAQVKALTSNMNESKWADAVIPLHFNERQMLRVIV